LEAAVVDGRVFRTGFVITTALALVFGEESHSGDDAKILF
jgi:hypothetical protein